MVLNREIEINNEIRTTCLPNVYPVDLESRKCYAVSLENKNGRYGKEKQKNILKKNNFLVNTFN